VETEPSLSEEALKEIIEIAQARATLLTELKHAVMSGDVDMIKHVAARLCGLDSEDSR
jgi:hypothetical protein